MRGLIDQVNKYRERFVIPGLTWNSIQIRNDVLVTASWI